MGIVVIGEANREFIPFVRDITPFEIEMLQEGNPSLEKSIPDTAKVEDNILIIETVLRCDTVTDFNREGKER